MDKHHRHTLRKGEFLECIQKEEIEWKSHRHFDGKSMVTTRYMNVPCVYDSETTKLKVNNIRTGFVHKWGIEFKDYAYVTNKIKEFIELLDDLRRIFHLDNDNRLIIYIHNLMFDFAFFRRLLEIDDIFIYQEHTPLYVVSRGIEFRCSYILSNERLEKIGEGLVKYKAVKKVGDLDYELCRCPHTPYTSKEYGYLFGDLDTTLCYIKEIMEQEGNNITRIPLTYTGWVRRDIKEAILNDAIARRLVQGLKLTTEEYFLWKRAFGGGFVHTNQTHEGIHKYQDEENEGITSYDFSSAHPAAACSEMFPMSNGVKVEWTGDIEEDNKLFYELLEDFILVFDIEFNEIKIKKNKADEPLNYSKCWGVFKHKDKPNVYHNGRIVYAKRLCTTMNSIDFRTIEKFYEWDSIKVTNCYYYSKWYLPKVLIEKILSYYTGKTELKGKKGKELEYYQWKKKINAIYGLMIQDIVRVSYGYDGNFTKAKYPEDNEIDDIIKHYNNSKSRCLWYPWGVCISSYTKANLFTGIYEFGEDYIYSDTDSIKGLRASKHQEYITKYNENITKKLQDMCDFYGIDKALLSPKTIDGIEKPLGCWDFDGHYTDFKALRAKTYIGHRDDEGNEGLHCVVAGISKYSIAQYLEEEAEKKHCSVYDIFTMNLTIPKGKADKRGRFYSDEELECDVCDYLGNTERVHIYGGVYIDDVEFSIQEESLAYIKKLERAEE